MLDESVSAQAAATLFQKGLAFHHQGMLDEAKDIYQRVLELEPQASEALHLLGLVEAKSNHSEIALDLIDRSLKVNPDNAIAWCNQGNILCNLERFKQAIESYDKAIAIKPAYALAHCGLGNALRGLSQHYAAIDSYNRAIAINATYADAYVQRGLALVDLNQFVNAIASFKHALAISSENPAILAHLYLAQSKFKEHQARIGGFATSHKSRQEIIKYYLNLGNNLTESKKYAEAIACFDEVIAMSPAEAFTYYYRGNALVAMRKYEAAIDSFDKATVLRPDLDLAHFNCSSALLHVGLYRSAIEGLKKVLEVNPSFEFFPHGYLLGAMMQICDWSEFDERLVALEKRVEMGEKAVIPFGLLGLTSSLHLQKEMAEIFGAATCPRNPELGKIGKRDKHERIRVGYFSADFHSHATSHLMAELFELHNKNKFQIVAFSFGPDLNDEVRQRLVLAFDQFIDINNKTDREAAQICRNLEIDIAVDLKGFTRDGRAGIFAYQAAPVQVSYLGYPGTMGMNYIDYIIADNVIIPPESQKFYTEKIVYLPNSYQVNDRHRKIAEKIFKRNELELPEEGFVYCCFNNNYKITPQVYDVWMRILKRVDGSVLWLFEENADAADNLRRAAQQRGVNTDQLVFAKRLPLAEHLARQRTADLFLDTLPYNAHTTASDALWAGVPVLTCMGETFAGRVAASLLSAMGLTELITTSPEAYETLAVELANNPLRLAQIKQNLAHGQLTEPLFDTALFTRHIEDAYAVMYQRYQAGLSPDHIHIDQ